MAVSKIVTEALGVLRNITGTGNLIAYQRRLETKKTYRSESKALKEGKSCTVHDTEIVLSVL